MRAPDGSDARSEKGRVEGKPRPHGATEGHEAQGSEQV